MTFQPLIINVMCVFKGRIILSLFSGDFLSEETAKGSPTERCNNEYVVHLINAWTALQ